MNLILNRCAFLVKPLGKTSHSFNKFLFSFSLSFFVESCFVNCVINRTQRKMVMCWAYGCNHYNVREKCRFFRIPKDENTRKKWLKSLRYLKCVSKYSSIFGYSTIHAAASSTDGNDC